MVQREIDGRWDETNLHGVDLRRSLLTPVHMPFIKRWVEDGDMRDAVVHAWLVLEECPDTRDGYKIIYDESAETFGLASHGFPTDAHPVIVGLYGDFWTTFQGM